MNQFLSPVDGADTGHRVPVADPLGQQPVADLPGEHSGILPLVVGDLLHHLGRCHLGLRATDHPWFDTTCLIVPVALERERERGNKLGWKERRREMRVIRTEETRGKNTMK